MEPRSRKSDFKIPKAYWHRFYIETALNPDYQDFITNYWEDYKKIGNFNFKYLKIKDIITYCLIVEAGDIEKCPWKIISHFRGSFSTSPHQITEGTKKIFLWTNSGLWMEDQALVKNIQSCTIHSCKKFIQELEKKLND